jgi:hypothetical protein
MLKKSLMVLLVLVMIMSLVGCGGNGNDVTVDPGGNNNEDPGGEEENDWKIGIMSSTVTQNEEEFRMAAEMQEKYGSDRILHTTYPDRFMQEQETTITNMLEMASTPGMQAIIMVQAVPGAVAAVDKVRELYPDMLFILGSPQEDPDVIAKKGDIVINTDDLGRGYQIVDQAASMGAEVIVHYSFPRHMSIEMLAERRRLMEERADQLGIQFVDEDAPDPTGDAGVPGTQQFIMEDVPRKIDQYGLNTAVFGTNCAMMEPLIRQAIDYGGIFPVQCCPSPYHALPAALAISVPDANKGDVPWILTQIGAKVKEAEASGRVATWPVPVNMMYIEAGVEYAIEYINGNTNGKVDKAKLVTIMEKIAEGSVTLTEYPGTNNYFLYLSDHIVF